MPTGFLISVRDFRAPIALVAAALVVLQTIGAGLATAHAAVAFAPNGAIICHGTGGAGPADGSAPDTDKTLPACCTYCAAAAPPILLTKTPVAGRKAPSRCARSNVSELTVLIAPRAVRAGASQAPPGLV